MKTKTIRSKVAKRVLAAMTVTIFVLSVTNLIYMSRRVIKEQTVEMRIGATMCANEVNGWLTELGAITETVADAESTIGAIREGTTRGIIDKIAKDKPDLYYVYVASEDGNIYMANNVRYASGVDVRERAWYKKVKEAGKTVIINPYLSATSKDTMLATVASPVYIDGQFAGAVGIDCDIATISKYIGSIKLKKGSYAFMIDADGNITTHPNEAFLPTVDKVTNAVDAVPELKGILNTDNQEPVNGRDYNGTRVMYTAVPIGTTGWSVVMALPTSAYMMHVYRGIAICAFIALVCLIFAAGDIATTIKRILLPIEHINPVMERILEGDFQSEVVFTKEQDELGQLQNKMAKMAQELADITQEQKYVLNEMASGNLVVEDMKELPGELNEISDSVNNIKNAFNDIISDIQFSAITLESYAMGINDTNDMEEMKAIFTELSAEADALMKKTEKFKTINK